ncbi:ATP-binding cassette domain-containing protein [Candidatus Nitrosotalea bavarica]|uniref:ATP-binding cassette domain-containing protein n=1 Tax=Candidatus Nitrosotalea bavarica TaxID=1903277 RepID=UPI000C70F3B2|nr:ATP-binding cassette domain-containing protein [Candidatus Nitrosotalea bavarica]
MDSSNFENTKAIETKNLTKIYHGGIRAVDDVTFLVQPGEIFGLLGPNGAGKTTMIKMIVTLARPTTGNLRVFGIDASKSPETVRNMLGYVPQSISVDTDLTGYENLLIFSKLSYVDKKQRNGRIKDALEYMGLTDRAKDLVKHYSGGMMRRLEIAQALVNRPRILLLDEPSIGLDPASKMHVWESIKQLKEKFGTTILITTHDMSEADELCDRIAIMSDGKIAALGSPIELKKSVGGDVVTVNLTVAYPSITFPKEIGTIMHSNEKSIQILAENGEIAIPLVSNFFRDQKIAIDSISINKPNLDDVFMKYAKRRLHEEISPHATSARRDFVRHTR